MTQQIISLASIKAYVRNEASRLRRQSDVISVRGEFNIKYGQLTQDLWIQFTVRRKVALNPLGNIEAMAPPEPFSSDNVKLPTYVVQHSYEVNTHESQPDVLEVNDGFRLKIPSNCLEIRPVSQLPPGKFRKLFALVTDNKGYSALAFVLVFYAAYVILGSLSRWFVQSGSPPTLTFWGILHLLFWALGPPIWFFLSIIASQMRTDENKLKTAKMWQARYGRLSWL